MAGMKGKVVLVTGAAHRVGAAIVACLHERGANIVLHYRNSENAAAAIASRLNQERTNSVQIVSANLNDHDAPKKMVQFAIDAFGQLDLLINNASSFYPTVVGEATLAQWDDLMASNLKAPFFLAQAAQPYLMKTQGSIVNIVDIHAEKPLKDYPIYCAAKAGLVMMTKSLAKELGPEIRVNAVAPGAILWPEELADDVKQEIVSRTALKRKGSPEDIAKAVRYLSEDAGYVTGQILAVDGGRSLNL